ncbi:SOS response-associated peptidase family protein [Plantibacter flavus]|uniref:SOS response-associated peptidase family protein n=1 Tax=Plantibacter flavus TaxID=150123 RepID=UPI002286657B|nr:SOS response-associated peptidase family protein [Plantibacter flavus]
MFCQCCSHARRNGEGGRPRTRAGSRLAHLRIPKTGGSVAGTRSINHLQLEVGPRLPAHGTRERRIPVHDRMPACLTPDGYDDWLGDHLDTDQLLQLLDRESFAVAHDLTHYEVTRDVNNVRNTGPHLIEPLPA